MPMMEIVLSEQEKAGLELDSEVSGLVRMGFYSLLGLLFVFMLWVIDWLIGGRAGWLGFYDRSWFLFFYFGILILSILTCISFMGWTSRMRKNLDALRVRGLKYEPSVAVSAYFTPFLNLVLPCLVLQEIARASQPQEDSADWTAWKNNPRSPLILIWWGLELASAMALLVTGPSHLERVLVDPGVMGVWLLKGGLMLSAAFLGIRIVRQVERFQGERWDAIQSWPPVQEDSALSPSAPAEEKTPPWEGRQGEQWQTLDVFPSTREVRMRPLTPVEKAPPRTDRPGRVEK